MKESVKELWIEPEIESLPVSATLYDLLPGAQEDLGSYAHGFPSFICDCS